MNEPENQLISTAAKWRLWLGAWGCVALISALPYPERLLTVPFFQVSLLAWLPRGEEKTIVGWMMIYPCLLGWVFYAFVSTVLFQIRKRNIYIAFYAGFCVLLALNLAGCKQTWEAVSGIH